MIVAFIGAIGAGKTTAAQALVEQRGYEPVNFADPLRKAMEILDPVVSGLPRRDPFNEYFMEPLRYNQAVEGHGYRAAKDKFPEIRRIMQRLGTDLARDQWDPDFWVKQWRKTVIAHGGGNVVADDARFPNEFAAIRSMGGAIIRIDRGGWSHPGPDAHESEQHWPKVIPNKIIRNDGPVEDLHDQVLSFRRTVLRSDVIREPDVAGRDIL